MTTTEVSSVVPSLAPPKRSPSADGPSLTRARAMSLARLAPMRDGAARYGLATVDDRGRVADHAIVRALGWTPGMRLDIRENGGLLLVTASDQGVFSVTRQGHVRLPATVRHWCGLQPGDRVLLVAEPADGLLIVHPPAALDTMVAGFHACTLAGEPR